MKLRRDLLSISIAAALLATTSVYAQSATPQNTVSAGESTSQPQTTTEITGASNKTAESSKPESRPSAQSSQNKAVSLKGIQVVGIRGSQLRSIQLKQNAPNIEDSISAENIGQLPDVTISDSLQRITGVQIDRTAGVGSSVEVRGLPEVATLMNGGAFLSAANIVSVQPDFLGVPSQLISGVDVMKSPTASELVSGISGTINLRTRQPWDMPFGWTFAGAAEAHRGSITKKTGPGGNFLVSFNDQGRWGALLSASYSDNTNNASEYGPDVSSGSIAGENAVSAQSSNGFIGAFGNHPIPDGITQFPDGSVDVNGDGKSDLATYVGHRQTVFQRPITLKRAGINGALQFDLGSGFTLTANGFYTKLNEFDRHIGIEPLPQNFTGKTVIPTVTHNTGVPIVNPYNTTPPTPGWNQTFYTTSAYKFYPADLISDSESIATHSISRNYSVKLNFDNGGAFTSSLRFISDSADQSFSDTDVQFSTGDGTIWPNSPADAAPAGVIIYPGGNRVFNPNGFTPDTVPFNFDYTNGLAFSTTPAMTQRLINEENYALKGTLDNSDNYNRDAGLNIIRFDGHYHFNDDLSVDFGLRNSIRTAHNRAYVLANRMYAGMGASDPDGCWVRYFTADVVLDGQGLPGACTAGNAAGAFRGGPLTAQPPGALPSIISDNMKYYTNVSGVNGLNIWALDPKAEDDGFNFLNTLYPGISRIADPTASWAVGLHEKSAYGQVQFHGNIGGFPVSGNAGVKVIRTNLHITQSRAGLSQAYGLPQDVAGTLITDRQYTDILPTINVAVGLTPKLKLRIAGSKNMMPLNLDQWGGALSVGYTQDITRVPGKIVYDASGASSSGNPNLKPWRSTNEGISLEYYMNKSTLLSLAAFRINVESFIINGSTETCDIPDLDGVIRRCVPVTEPVQGNSQSLHGFEGGWQEALTFLPGVLSHTGFDVNFTYSPSTSGNKDLAGNPVPFPDNSKKTGNLVLWYQDSKLQVRVAANYRSKEAVSQNVAGISGFERYMAPQTYVDASVSYQINSNVQVFLQGSNLTNEKQEFYDVFPSQVAYVNLFERQYFGGVRVKF